jgi:FAD-dependent oxidoreductase domain-containing protein 1
MSERTDVAIVGGAVMGSAVAYFLAQEPDFSGAITVIERDPRYAACATTRSWGGIRQQFSTPENVRMSLFGADFARAAAQTLAVDGRGPDLAFDERGYLFLADATQIGAIEENCARQRALGADVVVLRRGEIGARFPWLNLTGVAGASFGLRNEGWIDSEALLHGLRRKARALGVRYLSDSVTGVALDRGRVAGVDLRAGGRIGAGTVVDAAGPFAAEIAAMAGIALPVRPRKRMSYVFDCRTQIVDAPMTVDCSGVTFRPEGARFIAIASPPPENDPDCQDLDEDTADFDATVWPALAHRVPAFAAIKLVGAWAGHYDFNTFDQNAILGPHPEIAGFYFCNGFSGHGLQQAPAAGRAVAEHIVHGGYRSLDLSRLGFARVIEGRPLAETHVV